jgi:AcrR family transcriptional regulator
MEQIPTSVEEKIVRAAIDCIEKYGINGATNRKIAEMANVNSAAINYYFRSKEALIKRCMEVTLDNAFDWEGVKPLLVGSPKERCAAVFNEIIVGGNNFPGITRAHYYHLIVDGKYDPLLIEKLSGFIENMARDLKESGSDLDMDELRLACMQIASAVMLNILAPTLFKKNFGIDMHDNASRKRFVDRLVDRLLTKGS